MSPYFSVILPVYNVEAYLERCIRSVLAQSFGDYEIILVDDGSTDRSGAICDDYAARDAHIRVIHKPNGGLSSARNAGLQEARGEYVWFVDSDDWIEEGALQALHDASCKCRPDIVKFGYFRVEEQTARMEGIVQPGWYEGKEELEALRQLAFSQAGKFVLSAWSHVYRREFLLDSTLEFVSERLIGSEDYLFNLAALMHADTLCCMSIPLYSYELRRGSLTQRYKPDLPQRYTNLYHMLKEHAQRSGMDCGCLIDRFYVWHLMVGTCFDQEFRTITEEHDLQDGRRNVRRILRMPDFQLVVKECDKGGLSWKHRVQLIAMRMKLEGLFYWLYVVSPAGRRNRGKG